MRPRARVPISPPATAANLLVGPDGFLVIEVTEHSSRALQAVVESPTARKGRLTCGVLVGSHRRRDVLLVELPCFEQPVELVWRKRTWRWTEVECAGKAFTEQHAELAALGPC